MRSLIRGLPRLALGGVPAERAGDERLAWRRLRTHPTGIQLSADFNDGGAIPVDHTADGMGLPVPISWSSVTRGARSLMLLVEDPDAPTPNPFLHWAIYSMGPNTGDVAHALSTRALIGRNSMLRSGWAPCAPPKGDDPHRYVFQLFALDFFPNLGAHCGRTALVDEMRGHVLGLGLLTGTYQRK
ncbi:MAG TPA: YbhB/YbcL family Raf kinase inhibitor-like protein [Myxococcales bacterium]|nr:YbhB/YbcL family Raf kinase inhibitor-like protein [Myxococcales bacterium]